MKFYAIYIKNLNNNSDDIGKAQNSIATKFIQGDGNFLWAFIFSWLWLFYHRLWRWGLFVLSLKILVFSIGGFFPDISLFLEVFSLGISFLVGKHATLFLEKSAQNNGYELWAGVCASSQDQARVKFANDYENFLWKDDFYRKFYGVFGANNSERI